MFLFFFFLFFFFLFFFQAEDGIRDVAVTGVQTCALPISIQSVIQLGEVVLLQQYEHVKLLLHLNGFVWYIASNSNPLCSSKETSLRSEERRVGKECRSRWSTYH